MEKTPQRRTVAKADPTLGERDRIQKMIGNILKNPALSKKDAAIAIKAKLAENNYSHHEPRVIFGKRERVVQVEVSMRSGPVHSQTITAYVSL